MLLKFWKDHKADVTILVDTSWNWPHFFPSYYNLDDVSQDSMNKFLSHLIEKSLVELELSHCIEVGEVGLWSRFWQRVTGVYAIEICNKSVIVVTTVWTITLLGMWTSTVHFA